MNRRTIALLTMGIMGSLALAGCTAPASDQSGADGSSATPSPSAVACTPGTSTIYWDEAFSFGPVPVGSYRLEYAGAGDATTTTPIDLPKEPEYVGDGLKLLTQFDTDAIDEWKLALLKDVQRTGQVERDFGEPVELPATPSATMAVETPGTRVLVVSMDQLALPFEIDCGGEVTEGSVVAVDTDNTVSTFYECAALPQPATPESEVAEETCAAV